MFGMTLHFLALEYLIFFPALLYFVIGIVMKNCVGVLTTRVSSERKVSRKKCDNFRLHFANLFANMNEAIKCKNDAKFRKKRVEYSALRAKHLKFYYIILIISLPLL